MRLAEQGIGQEGLPAQRSAVRTERKLFKLPRPPAESNEERLIRHHTQVDDGRRHDRGPCDQRDKGCPFDLRRTAAKCRLEEYAENPSHQRKLQSEELMFLFDTKSDFVDDRLMLLVDHPTRIRIQRPPRGNSRG